LDKPFVARYFRLGDGQRPLSLAASDNEGEFVTSRALQRYYGSAFSYALLFILGFARAKFWPAGDATVDGLLDVGILTLCIVAAVIFISTRCEVCRTLLYRYDSKEHGWFRPKAVFQPAKCPVCQTRRVAFICGFRGQAR
jgi:hypothetical protein